MGFNSVFKGLR